jgi:hypothetical protein
LYSFISPDVYDGYITIGLILLSEWDLNEENETRNPIHSPGS